MTIKEMLENYTKGHDFNYRMGLAGDGSGNPNKYPVCPCQTCIEAREVIARAGDIVATPK